MIEGVVLNVASAISYHSIASLRMLSLVWRLPAPPMGGWSLGGAGGVHVFCRHVMAWLAHAIRFRCEVAAFTRFVTVRLSWALTLHSLLLWRWFTSG